MSRFLTVFVVYALSTGVFQAVGAQEQSHVVSDPYDRVALVNAMQRKGFESGPERGQELYYMKCWFCHNDYARAADGPAAAPTLRGLFQRPKLMNGQPVNNDTVAAWIRSGGPRMPAYTQTGLNDKDMQDLLAFLRTCGEQRKSATDGGCFDAHNPPPNPRYVAPLHVHEER